jgi:hypothetical protein
MGAAVTFSEVGGGAAKSPEWRAPERATVGPSAERGRVSLMSEFALFGGSFLALGVFVARLAMSHIYIYSDSRCTVGCAVGS